MAETRPSGSPIVGVDSASVIQEPATVDRRGRFHFLPRWTDRISWLSDIDSKKKESLVVLAEPGRVSFRDWEPDGPEIIERYKELEAETENFELLRLIQDRYQRVHISDRRLSLGDAILLHLGLPTTRTAVSPVYAAIFPDRLDVLSTEYRSDVLLQGHSEISDLP